MRFQGDVRHTLSALQERFEQSPAGEVVISTLVTVIMVVGLVWSAPDSAIRRSATARLEPLALSTGLDQSWYMFSPNPIRRSETVHVRVTTTDGRELLWQVPDGDVLTQFSRYRWHKIKEQAVRRPEIRAGLAQWAARQVARPADYPTRVEMTLDWRTFPTPGVAAQRPMTGSEVLYVANLEHP